MSIPKIIHHIAPKNKNDWHPIWNFCNDSWLQRFNEFKHCYWDNEDLEELIKDKFSNYHKTYSEFPKSILKYDFARLCILHEFGGIYADMDLFCYKNFFNELKKNVCIMGDTHKDGFYGSNQISKVTIGNSLICSSQQEPFLLECIDRMLKVYEYYKNKDCFQYDVNLFIDNNPKERMSAFAVLKMGSENIAEVINDKLEYYLKEIQLLPSNFYDSDYLEYKPEFFTKHLYTGTWDEQYVKCENKKDFANEHYKMLRNVDINFIKNNILH